MTRFKLKNHPFPLKPIRILLLSAGFSLASLVQAADLNTAIPESTNASFSAPINIDMPTMPLDLALQKFAKLSGMSIGFDNTLAQNKSAPAIKGRMTRKEALQKLLVGSGLMAAIDGDNVVVKKLVNPQTTELQLDKIQVRAKRFYEVGPLPGLGLTKEEIPGNVQSITAKEIKESHSLSLADLMNSKLQSVSVNDYQGNPFQMNVNYRGFTASPQLGTAQGISVFLDGIRVNEPFGDVVNWDMIPMNALSGLDIFPGSNPIFGLGTLGGALAMRTKSGFADEGVDAEILAGSYGRKQLQISGGGNNGVIAGFASGNFFLEDGWRDNSPSKVNQVFGKAEWRNEKVQLGLSMLYAGNKLTGNGLLPEQMAAQNRSQVYTSPDKSNNDLLQFQLNGIWDVTDTFNVTGQIYKRNSKRKSKTTDVNENFDGIAAVPLNQLAGKQVLYGFADVDKDGRPDFNNQAYNIAADVNGSPLATDGTVYTDPSTQTLARGSSFGSKVVGLEGVQGEQRAVDAQANPAFDSAGNPVMVPRWTSDPNFTELFFLPSLAQDAFNQSSDEYKQYVLNIWKNKATILVDNSTSNNGVGVGSNPLSSGNMHPSGLGDQRSYLVDFNSMVAGQPAQGTYTDSNGFYHYIYDLMPINTLDPNYKASPDGRNFWAILDGTKTLAQLQRNGGTVGNSLDVGDGRGKGVIEGTPTALITETEIDQIGTGGALQLNWNLDQHKLMVGASVDMADAKYGSAEYLGVLDNKRNGAAAPDFLGWEYNARDAASAIRLNDFKGDSITKSLYASETWAPTKTLNVTAAARYNYSTISNLLSVNRQSQFGAGSFLNFLDIFSLCTDTNNDGTIDPVTECPSGIPAENIHNTGEATFFASTRSLVADPRETYRYHSFNPSLGLTWQAREDLNIYGNWNKGARTPTVIELGCAFDATLVPFGTNPDGTPFMAPRSIAQRRTCNLPSTMSGDPYLKQVRSETIEFGARGNWTENLEWNTSLYRTNLTDDIYFVSFTPSRSFFQNIGDTRRQGLEMGVKGKIGKASFGVNYALTDATFQSEFSMLSPYNSSADHREIINTVDSNGNVSSKRNPNYQQIKVRSGDRLPGIPLHNLNFNFAYDVTDKWTVGLNAVMHSEALVRGNENNKHKAGPAAPLELDCYDPATGTTAKCYVPRADYGVGKTPGYTVFNLQSSYKFSPEWTFGMQINNLFDKEYASAGRLGLNAFSPTINGAVGDNGFNYNTNDWQGSRFLGLGAPRSAYFTLTYQFASDKKSSKSEAEAITVDLPLPGRPAEK